MIQERVERIDKVILSRLQYIGEKFVNNARKKTNNAEYNEAIKGLSHTRGTMKALLEGDSPSFTDRTGNLRSSIAYIVARDGKVIMNNFEISEKGKNGSDGLAKAKTLLYELVGEYSKGYVLIVIAGMGYAAAVESLGYDVITGSSIEAKQDFKEAIEHLKNILN